MRVAELHIQECGLRLVFAIFFAPHETSHTDFMNRRSQQMEDLLLVSHRLSIPNHPPVTPEMALTWPSSPLFDVRFHCCNHHRSGRNMSRIDFFVLNYSTQHSFNVMTPPPDSTILRASRSCLSTQGQSPAMARPPVGRCLSCHKNPFPEFLFDDHKFTRPIRRLRHSGEWNKLSLQLL
jgi:hypothetical protein